MSPEERRRALAEAFAAQGRSDWNVYKYLTTPPQPSIHHCHSLHYLQMATEKIAKAYRIRDTQADPDDLAKHHTGFEEFVNQFFCSRTIKDEYDGQGAALRELQKNAETVARQIENLAPAIDRRTNPENVEYPWERDGKVYWPSNYDYPNLSMLKQASGRAVMNLIERAFRDFEKI